MVDGGNDSGCHAHAAAVDTHAATRAGEAYLTVAAKQLVHLCAVHTWRRHFWGWLCSLGGM